MLLLQSQTERTKKMSNKKASQQYLHVPFDVIQENSGKPFDACLWAYIFGWENSQKKSIVKLTHQRIAEFFGVSVDQVQASIKRLEIKALIGTRRVSHGLCYTTRRDRIEQFRRTELPEKAVSQIGEKAVSRNRESPDHETGKNGKDIYYTYSSNLSSLTTTNSGIEVCGDMAGGGEPFELPSSSRKITDTVPLEIPAELKRIAAQIGSTAVQWVGLKINKGIKPDDWRLDHVLTGCLESGFIPRSFSPLDRSFDNLPENNPKKTLKITGNIVSDTSTAEADWDDWYYGTMKALGIAWNASPPDISMECYQEYEKARRFLTRTRYPDYGSGNLNLLTRQEAETKAKQVIDQAKSQGVIQ